MKRSPWNTSEMIKLNGDIIKRGDVFFVKFNPAVGSEQGGDRPVVVIQNDIGNKYSPTVIVAPLTTKKFSQNYPTNVYMNSSDSGLKHDSTVLLNQIITIDKKRLGRKLTHLKASIMEEVNKAIIISLGLIQIKP